MKVLFVWPGLTGYMGDCWRELAGRNDIDLKIAVDLSDKYFGGSFVAPDVLHGLDWQPAAPQNDKTGQTHFIISRNREWSPDVLFTVGWHNKICRAAVDAFPNARKVCCFDMPWEWRIRKFAARFILWRYLRCFDAAFVPGAIAAKYARWLGFAKSEVFTGLFATNTKRFEGHSKGGDGFLYVGRDAPEKGVDVLRSAHGIYRANGGRWPLRIVNGVPPDQLGAVYANADCFVLASRWEPWGVVLVEAAAAGLPIICTDKCGSRNELVKGNGLVVRPGDANALAEAMLKVERGEADINPKLGKELSAPYSCGAWADRVVDICGRLVRQEP